MSHKKNILTTFALLLIPVFFLCLFIAPHKVNACNTSIDPSDPGASEALDNCLSQQRILDQQARDQSASNAAHAQALYQIQIKYFYTEDAIEKQIDARNASDSGYDQYRLTSVDCLMSMDIPSDPTTMDPNLFLLRIGNKVKCVNYLNSYVKKAVAIQTVQPAKSNDQVCSDKFGQSWKWDGTRGTNGGLNCGCKDGYTSQNGQCVSYDQSCSISYSNSTWDGKYCSCNSGYIWNDQKTGCIVAPIVPVKTNDQVCSSKFGENSNWDGTMDGNGLVNCRCKQGLIWNSDRTACIVQPPSGPVCNGKSWKACPAGQTFSCPSTGDPQCLLPTPQTDAAPKINETVILVQPKTAPPTIKEKKIVTSTSLLKPETPIVATSSVASTSADMVTQPASAPVTQKKGFWSWFRGLFWF